ncbi:MBL fold metallo-hydrolase [Ramlibacter humi]|uniref:MBL fold metallo-hydrolase n=1 Tax=Ramlibacter humi TaxID=2530451 RepID=A0A4Z0CDU2_9BURK|nr:MBL fold metallo-hydrolase [Ramlibacter humi]TFZ08419.1 MBL fold metallo-hydrolase [Ramlibacter humi]
MNRLRCRACGPLFAALGGLGFTAGAGAADCDPRFANSPQFVAADCTFRNGPNPDLPGQRGSWDIWKRFLLEKKVGTVPEDPIPVRTLTRAALDSLDVTANHVIRLGHSSHLLKLRGTFWLIDPVFGPRASPLTWAGPKRFHEPPLALADLPPIDGLVLSHDHYDHLDEPTITGLLGKVKRYFVPLGVGARLRAMGVAADRIEEYDWWQSGKHGEVELVAAPAQHFSGRSLFDRNKTLWASWLLRSGGESIFYSGDSGYFPGFAEIGKRLGPFDIALMENGAYDSYWPAVHMRPEETVKAFRDLGARTLYLVHNSTFDLAFHGWREPLEKVAALAEQQGLQLATPEIGEVLTVGKPRVNTRWWEGLK